MAKITFFESDKEYLKRLFKIVKRFEDFGSFVFGVVVMLVIAIGILLGSISWREYLFGEPELEFSEEKIEETSELTVIESLPTQPDLYQKDGQWFAENLPASYIVKSGDSTWDIAFAVYGSGENYRDIEIANNLPLNADLQVGQTIILPDVPSLLIEPPQIEQSNIQIVPQVQGDTAIRRVHVVSAAEGLWQIAVAYYNDGNQWTKIYQANQHQMSSPDDVREGMELIIP